MQLQNKLKLRLLPEHTYNERELLSAIAEGDQSAFSQLLARHWSSVYVLALMYLKVVETAEELTQDVFVDIWEDRHKLPGVENFKNYLFIIARNKTYSLLRKRITRLGEEGIDELEEQLYVPDTQLIYKELRDILNKAIEKLPPKRRQVFAMSRLEGFSHAEIAERLNISKQTVNEHIVYALQFLRTFLKNHPELSLLLLAWTDFVKSCEFP